MKNLQWAFNGAWSEAMICCLLKSCLFWLFVLWMLAKKSSRFRCGNLILGGVNLASNRVLLAIETFFMQSDWLMRKKLFEARIMVFWFSSIARIQIHFFQSKPKWTLCVNCTPNVTSTASSITRSLSKPWKVKPKQGLGFKYKKHMVQVGAVLGSMAERAMNKRQCKSNLTEEIMADSTVVEYTKKIASTIEQKKATRF